MTTDDLGDGIALRHYRAEDLEDLVVQANHPAVARHLRDVFPSPYTRLDAYAWLATACRDERALALAITVHDRVIGGIGLVPQVDVHRHCAEIGYWLGVEWWGRGIATRAVAAMTRAGFERHGFHRLFALVYGTNPASMRVLEKNGYRYEGVLRQAVLKLGEYADAHVYGKLKTD